VTPRHFDTADFPDQELTGAIIGAFYYVYHCFGYGFLESVYRRALAVELRYRGIPVAEEVPFKLEHRGMLVGTPRADLVVGGRVIVEAKAGTILDPAAASQLQNYLRASGTQIGLLLHFGPTPAVKRLISSRHHLSDCSSDQLRKIEKDRAAADAESQ
jgi:GxxExxY protein